MGYNPRAVKTVGNTESRAGMKKKPLVQWMAMSNIITKEIPDMQRASYGPRAVKTDGDSEGV